MQTYLLNKYLRFSPDVRDRTRVFRQRGSYYWNIDRRLSSIMISEEYQQRFVIYQESSEIFEM